MNHMVPYIVQDKTNPLRPTLQLISSLTRTILPLFPPLSHPLAPILLNPRNLAQAGVSNGDLLHLLVQEISVARARVIAPLHTCSARVLRRARSCIASAFSCARKRIA